MHDQWVEPRPALGGKDCRDGPLVGGVGAEPVNGLGRERDKLPGAQQPRRAFDRVPVSRGERRGHGTSRPAAEPESTALTFLRPALV